MHSHFKANHRLKVHNVPFKLASSVSGYVWEKSHEIKKILVGWGHPIPNCLLTAATALQNFDKDRVDVLWELHPT